MESNKISRNQDHQEPRGDFRLAIIGPSGSGKSKLAKNLASTAVTFNLPLRTLSFAVDGYSDAILYGCPISALPSESPDLLRRWKSDEYIVHGISNYLGCGDLSRFSSDVPVVLVIDGVRASQETTFPTCGGGLLIETFQHPESIPPEMQPDGFLIQVGSSGTWTFRYSETGRGRKTAQWLRLDEIVNRVLCRQPLDLADTPFRNGVDEKMAASVLANCHHTVELADSPYRNVEKKMVDAILANCHHTVKFANYP